MEEPGRLQSMGLLRVRHDWATSLSLSLFTFMHWRRKWQPTPVFLPGESQGWVSLVGCRLWGHTESDTLKWLSSSSSSLDNGYVAPSFLYSLISLQIFDNLLQRISARIRYIQSALPLKWKKKNHRDVWNRNVISCCWDFNLKGRWNILNIESFCPWTSSQMLFLRFPPWSSPSPLLYILSGCQAFCFLTAWYKPHLYSQAWSFSSSQWPLLLGLL